MRLYFVAKSYNQLRGMFSKQEASQLKKEFWTIFGQYMKPVPSFNGEKVNWLNYKTGEKDVFFKMDANRSTAMIAIEIARKDPASQQIYFQQFRQLQSVLKEVAGEDWEWRLHDRDEQGRMISRIYKRIENVSIFNRDDWPALISFFKPAMLALDEFWNSARYAFEAQH